ncbi:hypothetical protein GOODEAATRI_007745 [Goodea atripinnis]|uniref:Uncharacterized protein n=1 Tax=Goodea atripinnis TaxID=208336 RepID=A0ABV0PLP4_9TELE
MIGQAFRVTLLPWRTVGFFSHRKNSGSVWMHSNFGVLLRTSSGNQECFINIMCYAEGKCGSMVAEVADLQAFTDVPFSVRREDANTTVNMEKDSTPPNLFLLFDPPTGDVTVCADKPSILCT